MKKLKNLILKRPAISIFIFYALSLIVLDSLNFYLPEKQSSLHPYTNHRVLIKGKVISFPENKGNKKIFVLKTISLNRHQISEKVLVSAMPVYKISYGDIIEIEGYLKKPETAAFPLIFDYKTYLARNKIYTTLNATSFEHIDSKPNFIMKLSFALQQDIIKKIDRHIEKPYSDILKPILIGDKSALTNEIKLLFIDAGIMHILVVSGLHVGFIGAIFLFIFKLSGLNLKKASLLSIPFLFLYVLATGANPPALRAAIMFSSILIALALNREPLIYNSLALSALIILILQPQQLFTASFQMSYLATIGIIFFYGRIFNLFKNFKNPFLKFIFGMFSVTISAQILLIPVCMYYFGKISLISIVANIVVVPTIGIVLALAMALYLSSFILPAAAAFLAFILTTILKFILLSTTFFGKLSFASVIVPKPQIAQIFLFYIFIFSVVILKNKLLIPAFIIIINLSLIFFDFSYNKNRILFKLHGSKQLYFVEMQYLKKKEGFKYNFFVYQKGRYYNFYIINNFSAYLKFSGISKADIYYAGFNKNFVDSLYEVKQVKNLYSLKSL